MWKGRGEIFDTHEGKPVDTGRIPVPGEGMTTEVSGHDHSGAGRSEKAVSDLYGQQEDIAKKYTALTFDDDVIIGLSQEISYKEAVSMI